MIFFRNKGMVATKTSVYPIGQWSQDQRERGFAYDGEDVIKPFTDVP
jgi:hypothetical protein